MSKYVEFTGEENEKEFLSKCLEQWDKTTGQEIPEVLMIMQLGTVFSEIRHRLEEKE